MKHLAGILLALGLAGPASGSSIAPVPDVVAPAAGTTVTVRVDVGAVEIGCFSFSVEYDPSALTYLGAQEGALFVTAPELTFFSDDVDESGRPQPNDCLLGFGTSVTGPGTIATLRFEVLAAAPTAIALRGVVLRDVDRLPIATGPDPETFLNTSTTSSPVADLQGGLSAWPNPSNTRVSLVLRGPASADAGLVSIFDIAGRRVRELAWPAGAQSLHWDGRDQEGRDVANGVYLARFESGQRHATTRIARVR